MGLLGGPADGQRPAGRPTTSSRACSRTSTRATRRCAATTSSARAAGTRHGLPVEIAVEQQLGHRTTSTRSRPTGSPSSTSAAASRSSSTSRTGTALTERIGFWIDLDDAYRTLDATLHRVGLVGAAPDPRQGPALRGPQGRALLPALRHGAVQPRGGARATRTSIDPSVYVRLPVVEDGGPLQAGDELLVWTTTPWTLVSNAAVAVDPELTYVRAKAGPLEAPVVLAEALVERVLGTDGVQILDRFPGAALDGVRYEPPFPYHQGRRLRRARPHRPARRLRHRRRRHRPRAHRDRLRRGRLPPRRAVRAERRQPGAPDGTYDERIGPTPGATSRTPTPTSSRTCARAGGCCAPRLRALLPALLALRATR